MFSRATIQPIQQTESQECILACLTMIARYHGLSISLRELRSRFPFLNRGGTLRDLLEIARSLDLFPRAVKVELHSLKHLQMPCIIHWSFNHFIVLERVRGEKITVSDPASGRRRVSMDAFSRSFTGIAVELVPNPTFQKGRASHPTELVDSLLPLRAFTRPIAQFVALSLAVLVFSLISPLAVQIIVDQVIQKSDSDLLLVVAGAFLFANLLSALATYIQGFHLLKHSAGARISATYNYLQRLMSKRWNYFERRKLGNFIAQYNSLTHFVNYVIKAIGTVISDALFVAVITVALFMLHPITGAVVLFVNFSVIAIRVLLMKKARMLQDTQIVDVANEEAFFVETMRGITSVKANRIEANRMSIGIDRTVRATNSFFSLGLFGLRYSLLMQFLKAVEVIVVLYLLAIDVMQGAMTIGMMYAFYSYRQFLDERVASLVDALSEMLNVRVHQERLLEVLSIESREHQRPDIGEFIRFKGKIELRNLAYWIDNKKKPVIEGFSALADRGTFVHIKGPTGSGKTTLLKIILGVLDQDDGTVLIDDIPLSGANIAILRNSVGVVLQEDLLFSGSILENVSLFDDLLDVGRVQHCCRIACIDDDIVRLPLGYQSLVGDLGANLSTGQQQRLLVARALYRDPTILVFDEASANLNEVVERELLGNLKALGKTVIFASHSDRIGDYCDTVWELQPRGDSSRPRYPK
ncbi:MAG: peptidase domain-containing ABC transporter [Mesorhizobium sp.]|uniref:peptidase domain-containing ABC transporter n=1 Tax=Mesorhizobium sp. TaxID=1871066 RepID=UPI000FE2A3A8|nr:peptidase domain-containing ABC transporter [Mesorhizobium sp.]RWK24212.1 MAG: peptidase domain-containing ABC transporter [Mesorhizobium sp.]RWK33267.1 MAG: peptidase domain-containing ABC transporter [Mesorhizobium sp.]